MNERSAASPTDIALPPTSPLDLSHLVEQALRAGRPAASAASRVDRAVAPSGE